MLKKLLPLLFLVMAVQYAHAFQLTVADDSITVSTASFREMEIKVASLDTDDVVFSLVDGKPWMTLDPTHVKLNSTSTQQTVKLIASPFIDTPLGLYKVVLSAESVKTGERKSVNLFISVQKGEVVDLESITVTGNLQPTGEIIIRYVVRNFRTSTAEDISISSVIKSPSGKIIEVKEAIPRMDPDETKTVEKSFVLPPQAEYGDYSVDTTLMHLADARLVKQSFYVSKRPVLKEERSKSSLIFGYKTEINVKNVGNAPASDIPVTDTISGFESAFMSSDKKPVVNGTKYTWNIISLQPGEEAVISYAVDYSPLYLFIIAIIVLLYLYFFKMRTVRVRKNVLQKKHIEEGEEFTIGVEIKNYSGKRVEELLVEDFVPTMFKVKEGSGPKATMKKSSVGTELVWKLSGMYHGEERVVSYKIVPAFGVHGKIRLPRASVKFKLGNKIIHHLSSLAHLGLEVDEEHPVSRLINKGRNLGRK
ncbi:MAG: hypothetical protein HY513_01900 [Candidatus Aenigmarchaeota archaeon]|nr:hypothetical protein [Candidatus Aenigmarchaeota archaeon]